MKLDKSSVEGWIKFLLAFAALVTLIMKVNSYFVTRDAKIDAASETAKVSAVRVSAVEQIQNDLDRNMQTLDTRVWRVEWLQGLYERSFGDVKTE